MVAMVFYEKPGCRNNALQKQMLRAAGHQLETRDLLRHAWTESSLLAFLSTSPYAGWFNGSAPAITGGTIKPESMTPAEALAAMLADPLLIRRPLMQVGDARKVGFDIVEVHQWIGLRIDAAASDGTADLETCRQSHRACP